MSTSKHDYLYQIQKLENRMRKSRSEEEREDLLKQIKKIESKIKNS